MTMIGFLKKSALGLAGLLVLSALLGWGYVHSLDLDAEPRANPKATASDLTFVRQGITEARGRILAVVSSTPQIGDSGKRTGYELTELSRAYWVFVANGYAVDIASPQGGEPPMVLDEDLLDADHAFLNDPQAQRKSRSTLRLADVDPTAYDGVYFVGGKGAMFDFPGNADIQRIVAEILPRGAVGAVCHGPAALIGLRLADGTPVLAGRKVTGFSNDEELFLIENARARFPFLLQEQLQREAGDYREGPMYLDNTQVDGRLVTGQNPWSTWSVAESMIRVLGHAPVPRQATTEEISIDLLATYRARGLSAALARKASGPPSSKQLLLMHAVVAGMQYKLGEAWELQRLARHPTIGSTGSD
jgi:putative intracellular protease/amidase